MRVIRAFYSRAQRQQFDVGDDFHPVDAAEAERAAPYVEPDAPADEAEPVEPADEAEPVEDADDGADAEI